MAITAPAVSRRPGAIHFAAHCNTASRDNQCGIVNATTAGRLDAEEARPDAENFNQRRNLFSGCLIVPRQ